MNMDCVMLYWKRSTIYPCMCSPSKHEPVQFTTNVNDSKIIRQRLAIQSGSQQLQIALIDLKPIKYGDWLEIKRLQMRARRVLLTNLQGVHNSSAPESIAYNSGSIIKASDGPVNETIRIETWGTKDGWELESLRSAYNTSTQLHCGQTKSAFMCASIGVETLKWIRSPLCSVQQDE